jgi:hypothetical protein
MTVAFRLKLWHSQNITNINERGAFMQTTTNKHYSHSANGCLLFISNRNGAEQY